MRSRGSRLIWLAATSHPGPSSAVTILAALLGVALGADVGQLISLTTAVLTGQLVIGWSNDLIDADRDRIDARPDKPLATGALTSRFVGGALAIAAVITVMSSISLGWLPGLLHLGLVVGSGVAYNLGLKATTWSFVPYAVAFGALPVVVWCAVHSAPEATLALVTGPPVWMPVVGALLGVGAHLLNALPDLQQDRAHGIHGLPHRLGGRWVQMLAPPLLLVAVVIATVIPAGPITRWGWVVLVVAGVLAVVAGITSGKTPFRAAIGIALLAVTALVAAAP